MPYPGFDVSRAAPQTVTAHEPHTHTPCRSSRTSKCSISGTSGALGMAMASGLPAFQGPAGPPRLGVCKGAPLRDCNAMRSAVGDMRCSTSHARKAAAAAAAASHAAMHPHSLNSPPWRIHSDMSTTRQASITRPCHAILRRVVCLAHDPPGPTTQPPASPSSSAEPSYSFVDPVNRMLMNLLPPARDVAAELSHIDWQAAKVKGKSLDALASIIEEKLMETEWFVTGNVDPSLFAEGFVFKDENVATAGIRSYALGVRKLFDQATARAQVISVTADAAQRSLVVTWRLEGCVNLPFKPRIPPYIVTTTLAVDGDGLVCSQLDEFGVPGWQLLAGALLGAWAGPAPPPPVEELRAAAQQRR